MILWVVSSFNTPLAEKCLTQSALDWFIDNVLADHADEILYCFFIKISTVQISCDTDFEVSFCLAIGADLVIYAHLPAVNAIEYSLSIVKLGVFIEKA